MCPSVSPVLLTAMAEALDQQKVASSEFHHCFSDGLNASGLAVALGTPDNISKGLFLADILQRLSQSGFVDLGVKGGDEDGSKRCMSLI